MGWVISLGTSGWDAQWACLPAQANMPEGKRVPPTVASAEDIAWTLWRPGDDGDVWWGLGGVGAGIHGRRREELHSEVSPQQQNTRPRGIWPEHSSRWGQPGVSGPHDPAPSRSFFSLGPGYSRKWSSALHMCDQAPHVCQACQAPHMGNGAVWGSWGRRAWLPVDRHGLPWPCRRQGLRMQTPNPVPPPSITAN